MVMGPSRSSMTIPMLSTSPSIAMMMAPSSLEQDDQRKCVITLLVFPFGVPSCSAHCTLLSLLIMAIESNAREVWLCETRL